MISFLNYVDSQGGYSVNLWVVECCLNTETLTLLLDSQGGYSVNLRVVVCCLDTETLTLSLDSQGGYSVNLWVVECSWDTEALTLPLDSQGGCCVNIWVVVCVNRYPQSTLDQHLVDKWSTLDQDIDSWQTLGWHPINVWVDSTQSTVGWQFAECRLTQMDGFASRN